MNAGRITKTIRVSLPALHEEIAKVLIELRSRDGYKFTTFSEMDEHVLPMSPVFPGTSLAGSLTGSV
jgi:hypothetical protein